MYEIFLAIVVSLIAVFRFCKSRKNPPGPWGLPLVGYLPFLGSHPAKKYVELSEKYGPVITVDIGPQTIIVLNDIDSIQEAFVKRSNVFSGRPQSHVIKKMTRGHGIVLHEFNEHYKVQRKFSMASLREFGVGKRRMEDKIIEEFGYLSEEIKSHEEVSFDCQKALASAVSNVISSILFGSRFSYEDEDFLGMLTVINQQFSSKFDAICLNLLMIAPMLRFIPPISKAYKRILENSDYFIGILEKILKEQKETFDPDCSRGFIDEYLKELQKGNPHQSFCEVQLLRMESDMFIAGTETSATTLRWAILLFAHRPDIQEKAHGEVEKVIGDSVPSMKHKESMPYLSALIQELMRHRTLTPLALPHCTTENVSFRGYDIPKGTMVVPNLWAVHHDQRYFENPNEFLPERFIDDQGNFMKDKRVIPFSVGPRNCMGELLARMEIFLFLASIVQRFEVRVDQLDTLPSFNEGVFGPALVPNNFEVSFIARM